MEIHGIQICERKNEGIRVCLLTEGPEEELIKSYDSERRMNGNDEHQHQLDMDELDIDV